MPSRKNQFEMLTKPKQCVSTSKPIVISQVSEETRTTAHNNDNDPDNLAVVCRVCLAMEVCMYHISEHELSTMFEEVIGVEINAEDKLPQQLCWECAARLSSAYNFYIKALRTHRMLSSKLTSGKFLSMSDIRSIDRAKHQLESRLSNKLINNVQETCEFDSSTCAPNDNENDANDVKKEMNMSDHVMIEIDSVKKEHMDTDDELDIDNEQVTEEWTFIVDDENEKILSCKKGLFDDGNLNYHEMLVPEDNTLIKTSSQSSGKELSANATQSPKNKDIVCKSGVNEIVLEDSSDTEEIQGSIDTLELEDEIIESLDSDSDNTSDNNVSSNANTDANVIINKTKSKKNIYICDICNRQYNRKHFIIKHIQNHPKLNYCKYCTYKTPIKCNLKRHINCMHTKTTTYKCSYCSYSAFDNATLTKHIDKRHDSPLCCSYCSFKTYRKRFLVAHINMVHDSRNSKSFKTSISRYKYT